MANIIKVIHTSILSLNFCINLIDVRMIACRNLYVCKLLQIACHIKSKFNYEIFVFLYHEICEI